MHPKELLGPLSKHFSCFYSKKVTAIFNAVRHREMFVSSHISFCRALLFSHFNNFMLGRNQTWKPGSKTSLRAVNKSSGFLESKF
jgi:hypothetical protein